MVHGSACAHQRGAARPDQAEQDGADYGAEWGAMLAKTFAARYTLGIKYARYDTDADAFVPGSPFTTNVSKLWVWPQLKI